MKKGKRFGNFTGIKGSGTSKIQQRNVSGFKRVDAGGALNVEVDAQKDFSVTVEADDNLLEHIKTEVNGDTLKIYSEGKISPTAKLNVKISMPEIQGLNLSGASDGKITNVRTDSLELKASGASEVVIVGEAKTLEADASGASTIDAENLDVEDANVEASGASKAMVSATNNLEADASGASKISYTGEPKNIKQNSSGASSINKK
ncbi:MAG: DUF2807 domain-containing protein [Acidobacteria bacterium]|nr:DUF2807 domain-containing protein [Acidobacteriota bacterium]